MRDSFWHCNWGRCAQSRHPCWSLPCVADQLPSSA
jgi:hypothetical protein